MDSPVTHRQLRTELAKLKVELVTKAELHEALANYPTKAELREALANLPTKADLENHPTKADLANHPTKADLANHPTKADLENHPTKADLDAVVTALIVRMDAGFERVIVTLRTELHDDLLQQVRAFEESTRVHIAALDDKYADLPNRVTRLEDHVYTKPDRR